MKDNLCRIYLEMMLLELSLTLCRYICAYMKTRRRRGTETMKSWMGRERMDERMNEWVSEWNEMTCDVMKWHEMKWHQMKWNEWMNDRAKERPEERKTERRTERPTDRPNEQINQRINESINPWINQPMHQTIHSAANISKAPPVPKTYEYMFINQTWILYSNTSVNIWYIYPLCSKSNHQDHYVFSRASL